MSKKSTPVLPTSSAASQEIEVGLLDLDEQNPRITSLAERGHLQDDLLKALWKNFSVDEIAMSIAANGFFRVEPLFVEANGGRYTVIEGNRRLAAVRLLIDEGKRRLVGATDLPRLTASIRRDLRTLPTIICTRETMWQYLGFRHINGPQEWDSESKAAYIGWVHNRLRKPLDVISRTIGDTHATVRRLYKAQMVLEQAERLRIFARADRQKRHFAFSHLSTGLGYEGIQKFLGIREASQDGPNPVPSGKREALSDFMLWLYGSKSGDKRPLVESQNPHLRQLDEVVRSAEGIAALRQGLPLEVASEIAKGDERVFREALQGAKLQLQKALGTLPTGFKRRSQDALGLGEDVAELASQLLAQMRAKK